jgi:hypothetical protein
MNMIIRGGVLLGVLVTAFTWLFAFTGMHKSPGADMTFIIVATIIEIAVLVWALRKTAAQGRGWMGQVSAGTMLAFVGGCLIFATSFMLVAQLYPNYFAEVNAAATAAFRAKGMDDAAIAAELAKLAPSQTPLAQSVTGFVATVVTGLIVSAIAAIWIRHKGPQPAGA